MGSQAGQKVKATVFYLDWGKKHGIQIDIQHGHICKPYEVNREMLDKYYYEVCKLDVNSGGNELRICEDIYRRMNEGINIQFKERSMSVCDIVRIGRKYFIVSALGFKRLEMK